MAHAGGRPTDYNLEIAHEICDMIATTKKGVEQICLDNKDRFPAPCNVFLWLYRYPEFQEIYARAKAAQVELLMDQVIKISDDISNETIVKKNKQGDEFRTCNSEWVNNKRLMVDSRFRLAEKLKPRKYGNKIEDDDKTNVVKLLLDKLAPDTKK